MNQIIKQVRKPTLHKIGKMTIHILSYANNAAPIYENEDDLHKILPPFQRIAKTKCIYAAGNL